MKKNFTYRNGKILVTWNEQPMVNDYQRERHTIVKEKKTIMISTIFEIGVELELHRGGRICYGFLAANVRPHNEQGRVKISIAFTQENTVRYEDSCLLYDSFVYKGLPKEYLKQVGESMTAAIEREERYAQSEILVDYSANCEIGSSPMLFGLIGEMLVKLINIDSMERIMDMEIQAFTEEFANKFNLRY